MKTRTLGQSGVQLTPIGLGTWAIGGSGWDYGWGPQDDADSIATIHRALDSGINWIDTAPVYGFGHSETIVGRALAERSDEVFVATKCGLCWRPGNPTPFGRLRAESVRSEAEDSLRRLGREVIDLLQIHWPNPDEDIEEAWGVIADLIGEGKVRYGGVSNFNVAQLERVQAIHPVTSLQPPYSLLQTYVERELLPYCGREGIGVIAYSPMQTGLLTGAFDKERVDQLPSDDWRRRSSHFQEPALSTNLELVHHLAVMAADSGHTAAQLAIAWVLRRSEVNAAIVGARRPEQIEETVRAGEWNLTDEEIEVIESLRASILKAQ